MYIPPMQPSQKTWFWPVYFKTDVLETDHWDISVKVKGEDEPRRNNRIHKSCSLQWRDAYRVDYHTVSLRDDEWSLDFYSGACADGWYKEPM